jgi:hypothetical protein
VTFGGHGRNAEVFEALKPDGAARAFEEFALFLESIGSRPDIRLARSDWIEEFTDRARRAARRGHDEEAGPAVRLVHSLEIPVAEQLPALLEPYGPCAEATIMSPYHDPDGSAVRHLLDAIDAPRGVVAVSANNESPFPFATAAAWQRPVTPVRLREPEKRFVHAKWYEFSQQRSRLLLTGSINATRKALTTTDNVELGVLRIVGKNGRPIDWVSAAVPAFAAQKPLPSGLGSQEIAYASFDRTEPDRLSGHLITLQPAAGLWQLRLVHADGDSVSHAVEVDEAGRFTFRNMALESFSQAPAVQILMTVGDREARGWVHNDMLLGMSARRRLTAGVLARLMRRDATDDDIQALLDYLSIHAEQHLRLFNLPIAGQGGRDEDGGREDKAISVHIDELAALHHVEGASPLHSGAGPAPDDQFHAAMARLRRVLLGHGRERRKALDNGRDAGLAEDEAEAQGSRTPEQIAEALGLSDFEHAIGGMIEEAKDRPEIRDGLLAMLLEVSMDMRLHRLDDKDGAHESLNAWFFKACRLSHADLEKRTALQQHVLTAATLYVLARRADTRSLLATELHDSLERYYQGPADREHALRSVIPDPRAGFAAALIGDSQEFDLAAALNDILATRTRRQQLEDALSLGERGETVPAGWEVFRTPLGRRLWEALENPHPQKRVRRSFPGLQSCAFDYFAFARQEAARFERERIGFCVRCRRFTVNTTP